MDALTFAKAMIKYEELHREMKELETVITEYVLERQETQAIGNVKAKYANGRTEYDYQKAAKDYGADDPVITSAFTKTTVTIDWRGVCAYCQITEVPIKKQPVPYVKVEVADDV